MSETKGRKGERFISPTEQRERIEQACEREGLRLLDVFEELDVSGGRRLEDRPKLLRAVEAIESGEASVIAAAYFDRLFRSLTTQAEVVDRVERAGGQVLAIDTGRVTNGSAAQWLSGIMLGGVSEYFRRSARERTADAQRRAVERGVPPWPRVTPGYRKGEDGRYVPDPAKAPVVAEAFARRAGGRTVREVCDFLHSHGIEMTPGATRQLLASRVVLGEIHFGELVNLQAHPPIVDRELWRWVQRMVVPSGRRPRSERLLARLGILRCGSCGSPLMLSSTAKGRYHHYRCSPMVGDCPARVTISADTIERVVADAVKAALGDVKGRASAMAGMREAEEEAERSRANYEAALQALADFTDAAAVARLRELRDAAEEAEERLAHLGGRRAEVVISAAGDWERLTLSERRDLVRAVVERVDVAPGHGPERVTIESVGEWPSRCGVEDPLGGLAGVRRQVSHWPALAFDAVLRCEP